MVKVEELEYKHKKGIRLSAIIAQSLNNGIGLDGHLPWHEATDLKFFMDITMAKWLLMGRRTWESFKKPLPGRQSIVLTGKTNLLLPENVHCASNLRQAMEIIPQGEEIFVIGGKRVYEDTFELVDEVWITLIKIVCHSDVYFNLFSKIDPDKWELMENRSLSNQAELFAFKRKTKNQHRPM